MSHDHIPNTPTALTATFTDNGRVRLMFEGNSESGSVYYLIWRRDGIDGRWLPRDMTEEQGYVDVNLTPGEIYAYRIQAQAPLSVSSFSNTVVVEVPELKSSAG